MPCPSTSIVYFSLRFSILFWLFAAGAGLAQSRTVTLPPKGRPQVFIPQNPPISAFDGLQTIDNGKIKVGVDSRYGGAITYLSTSTGKNMVNNVDLGRQIQIGLYSGPIPYSEGGKDPNPSWVGLGWNPIQAGDVYGNASNVLDFKKEANLLYVKTQPRHFALDDVLGEAYIEHWVKLEGNVVKVHAKATMFRTDQTQFEARQQELPCLYLNGPYHNMYAYTGANPYTYDGLMQIRPPTSFGDIFPTEPWMASTDDNGNGVGLFVGNNYDFKKGYFGSDLAGDEFSNDASYIAATPFLLLDHNLTHEWDYELVVGHITDIRSYMYAKPRPPSGPNYSFTTTRQGWHYFNAKDNGFPIQSRMHVNLTSKQRDLIQSPAVFWRGGNNPKLYLRAAFQTQNDKFRLSWRKSEDPTIYRYGDRYIDFPIINDGQVRTYEIDLSQKIGWIDSNIGQLELRPPPDGADVNGWVELEWLAPSPNGPDLTVPPTNPDVCVTGCAPIGVDKVRFVRGSRTIAPR